MIARALTWIESGREQSLRPLISGLFPWTGSAWTVGVTGPPGVGKSTLTSALVSEFRSSGSTVAVLAVDPSSPFSGGALLGDRVRMQEHHGDQGVFIRSMASRGHLGGLSASTPQAVLVLDAAGFDGIIIETVGVGQSEVEVASTADTTVLVQAPGMGDSIQAAKAGVLEVADVMVVNKADQPGAGKLEAELRHLLEAGHAVRPSAPTAEWWPPIQRAVAVRGEGIADLAEAIQEHRQHLEVSQLLVARRYRRAAHMIRAIALAQISTGFSDHDGDNDSLVDTLARRVVELRVDPYTAGDQLVARFQGCGCVG